MLTLYDEFAGWGGSSQGAAAVPGVQVAMAVNHVPIAVDVHAMNFPDADHHCGDATKLDLTRFPRFDLFWASPACPPWTDARGVRRDFDRSTQGVLLAPDGTLDGLLGPDPATQKRRALMEEIPRYLRAMVDRGQPVLAGVVENVVQVAKWDQFHRWIREIQDAAPGGYSVRIIALNAMHARPTRTRRAPQSRDRFFAAYWLNALGRTPDWDKWLRPRAWCPLCEQWVDAVQVFKTPGQVMGRYGARHGQYVYRCPRIHGAWTGTHRPGLVNPEALPAATAIDWTLDPGPRIGDRTDPLEPATLARIDAWLRKNTALPLAGPACPANPVDPVSAGSGVLMPTTARDHTAYPTGLPLRTQTTRRDTALVLAPFLASLRGGGAKETARGIDEPLLTFSASGTHHALIHPPAATSATLPTAARVASAVLMRHNTSRGDGSEMPTRVEESMRTLTTTGHQSLITWDDTALMPYYGNDTTRPVTAPIGTLTTRDRYALVAATTIAVEECTFRMLAPHEIAAGMAFAPDYRVKGTKRERVAGYGNAVCPPCAEVIVSALVEAVTGQDLPRAELPW